MRNIIKKDNMGHKFLRIWAEHNAHKKGFRISREIVEQLYLSQIKDPQVVGHILYEDYEVKDETKLQNSIRNINAILG